MALAALAVLAVALGGLFVPLVTSASGLTTLDRVVTATLDVGLVGFAILLARNSPLTIVHWLIGFAGALAHILPVPTAIGPVVVATWDGGGPAVTYVESVVGLVVALGCLAGLSIHRHRHIEDPTTPPTIA